jgi:hypothetical protein
MIADRPGGQFFGRMVPKIGSVRREAQSVKEREQDSLAGGSRARDAVARSPGAIETGVVRPSRFTERASRGSSTSSIGAVA